MATVFGVTALASLLLSIQLSRTIMATVLFERCSSSNAMAIGGRTRRRERLNASSCCFVTWRSFIKGRKAVGDSRNCTDSASRNGRPNLLVVLPLNAKINMSGPGTFWNRALTTNDVSKRTAAVMPNAKCLRTNPRQFLAFLRQLLSSYPVVVLRIKFTRGPPLRLDRNLRIEVNYLQFCPARHCRACFR